MSGDNEPISLAGLRQRIEFIRDHAAERPDMSPHDRGRLAGARDALTLVLDQLDRVQCACSHASETPTNTTASVKPLLQVLDGGVEPST